MDKVVIALGGSIVAPADPDPHSLVQVAEAIRDYSLDAQVLVVVGGGQPARQAIELARHSSSSEDDLDWIGIAATRLNAHVLLAFLKGNGVETNHAVPTTTDKAVQELGHHSVVVMGGTEPGHSTDFVAAELAQKVGADRLVIITNVDGVYNADPRQDPEATRFESLDFGKLLEVVGGPQWRAAGSRTIVDGPAAQLLTTSHTETCVVKGDDWHNVGYAVRGKPFHGTVIRGDA
jgi:uridylate kinase